MKTNGIIVIVAFLPKIGGLLSNSKALKDIGVRFFSVRVWIFRPNLRFCSSRDWFFIWNFFFQEISLQSPRLLFNNERSSRQVNRRLPWKSFRALFVYFCCCLFSSQLCSDRCDCKPSDMDKALFIELDGMCAVYSYLPVASLLRRWTNNPQTHIIAAGTHTHKKPLRTNTRISKTILIGFCRGEKSREE